MTVDRAKFVRSPSNSSRNPKLDLLYLTCGDSAQNLIEYVLDLSTQKIWPKAVHTIGVIFSQTHIYRNESLILSAVEDNHT